MGNLVIALLVIGFGLMLREIVTLNAIWNGLRIMKNRKLEEVEIKKLQRYTIETMFLTFVIVSILLAMSLFAYEGVM